MYVDSNSIKNTIYNYNELFENEYHTIYFKNTNINKLKEVIKKKKLNILSYIINDKKVYASTIDKLSDELQKEMNIEEKNIFNIYGIKIDGINLMCTANDILNLKEELEIY